MLLKDHTELKSCVDECKKCQLCETRKNTVIFDGNEFAKLMFIGEGPGEQEDLTGIPFVGRAGQLLDKILEAAKIDRKKETYICNVVKCRPPDNRVPSEAEAKNCIDYLKWQISKVNPQIVVFLGATALKYALGMKDPKITKLHGQWFPVPAEFEELYGGRLLMPFYHPSYLLRNPSKEKGSPKWQAWQAIKEIKLKLTEIAPKTAQ